MKRDIILIFNDFFCMGYLDWRLNITFISLIPKEKGDKFFMVYRPISVLSGLYKVISKVLVKSSCLVGSRCMY